MFRDGGMRCEYGNEYFPGITVLCGQRHLLQGRQRRRELGEHLPVGDPAAVEVHGGPVHGVYQRLPLLPLQPMPVTQVGSAVPGHVQAGEDFRANSRKPGFQFWRPGKLRWFEECGGTGVLDGKHLRAVQRVIVTDLPGIQQRPHRCAYAPGMGGLLHGVDSRQVQVGMVPAQGFPGRFGHRRHRGTGVRALPEAQQFAVAALPQGEYLGRLVGFAQLEVEAAYGQVNHALAGVCPPQGQVNLQRLAPFALPVHGLRQLRQCPQVAR